MSYWGTVSGKCLSKRPRHTQNKLGKFTERQAFARDTQTLLQSVPKGPFAAKCRTAHASAPNNQRTKTLLPSRRFLPRKMVVMVVESPWILLRISSTAPLCSLVPSWSHSTSQDPKSTVPNWHISLYLLLFLLTCPTPFSPGCGFRVPPLM